MPIRLWGNGRCQGWDVKGEAYEETMSPRKAFSFAIRGNVFVKSICALA